jgi:phosphoglucosamine mutase
VLVQSGQPASKACHQFDKLPQLLKSVRFAGVSPLQNDRVITAIAEAERELAATGRLLIRKSGTEPVIRVMAEGEDAEMVGRVVDTLCDRIAEAAAGSSRVNAAA